MWFYKTPYKSWQKPTSFWQHFPMSPYGSSSKTYYTSWLDAWKISACSPSKQSLFDRFWVWSWSWSWSWSQFVWEEQTQDATSSDYELIKLGLNTLKYCSRKDTSCTINTNAYFQQIPSIMNPWRVWNSEFMGGRIAQWVAFSLPTQQPRVRFSAFPKFYFLRKLTLSILPRLINSTALLSVKWTVYLEAW